MTNTYNNLPILNFPSFSFHTKKEDNGCHIFDIVRKKYVSLTPEEWVRQHVIHYLHNCKGYPLELMQVEGSISINGLSRRFDLVVFNKHTFTPFLLVECKQHTVAITQKVFDQVCRYNLALNVPHLFITNGLQHYCFSLIKSEHRFEYHSEIPKFPE